MRDTDSDLDDILSDLGDGCGKKVRFQKPENQEKQKKRRKTVRDDDSREENARSECQHITQVYLGRVLKCLAGCLGKIAAEFGLEIDYDLEQGELSSTTGAKFEQMTRRNNRFTVALCLWVSLARFGPDSDSRRCALCGGNP